MKKKVLLVLLLCLLGLFASGCMEEKKPDRPRRNHHAQTEVDLSHGSAGDLDGKTLIVSVFVDDIRYSWDRNSRADRRTIDNIRDYLQIATRYLSNEASEYGKKLSFEYDFDENPDLVYYAEFDVDCTGDDFYYAEVEMNIFLHDSVDSEELYDKYDADNIIYFMFFNTDDEFYGSACTRNWYLGMDYPYEIVFMPYMDYGGHINCPAVYAHEMLHTYGAPDLYYADEEYSITEEYLEYVMSETPNDIMYYCSDISTGEYVYDRVTNELTEIDAYYVGLTDECDLVDEYGLRPSQHIGG